MSINSQKQQINQQLNPNPQTEMHDVLQRKQYNIDKNRLLLVSFVNLLTTCCFIFSMLFYQWTYITLQPTQELGNSRNQVTIWSHLLYASIDQQSSYYLSYTTVKDNICDKDDSFCQSIFVELDFIGKLCFGILLVAFIVTLYDVVRIIRYWCTQLVTKSKTFHQEHMAINFKNNYRVVFMFVTYIIGISLNFFAIANMTLVDYQYGASFWVFLGSLIVFALASIYENRKMARMEKQQMVIKLLENQKKALQGSKISQSSASQSFTPI